MPRAWNTLILIAAILGLTATAALADTHNDHRFSLSLGAFITDRDTEAALDGTLTDGTPTDFEKDLGLDSSDTVFRIDGYFKINERHRIDFSVFDLSRDASRQITRDIQWGDTLHAVDNEGLLVAFLEELRYLAESENLFFDDFSELKVESFSLTGMMKGNQLRSMEKEIKAVTFHNLAIRRSERRLEVEIVFDV